MNYQNWPGRTWTIKTKATGVTDLEATDTVSFTHLGTNLIRVSGVGCSHTPTHSGTRWQEVCQPVSGNPEIVEGATIRIKSEPVGGKTRLTCTVIAPPIAPPIVNEVVAGGGACWTAEDG